MRVFINIRDLYDDCENRIFSILSSARDVREPAFLAGKRGIHCHSSENVLSGRKKTVRSFYHVAIGRGLKNKSPSILKKTIKLSGCTYFGYSRKNFKLNLVLVSIKKRSLFLHNTPIVA